MVSVRTSILGRPRPLPRHRRAQPNLTPAAHDLHPHLARAQNLPAHQDAVIPVEKATGPMLLVCGGADTLWPSCDMSRAIEKRAADHGGKPVTVLPYPQAGHLIMGPPSTPEKEKDLTELGGTVDSNLASKKDSWPKVLAFLHRALGA